MYYTISRSSNSKYVIHSNVTKSMIIDLAWQECDQEGESLYNLAGIKMITIDDETIDAKLDREFKEGEEIEMAIEKLSDNCRLFNVFKMDDERAVKNFLNDVEKKCPNLFDAAKKMVLNEGNKNGN